MTKRCTIIAEVSVNHDGDLGNALRLCDAAKSAGADIVKFQTFVPTSLFRMDRWKDPKVEQVMGLALDFNQFTKIAAHCADIGIEFCSTPDDLASLKFLVEVCGVKRIKLGSGSLLYEPLVDATFDTGLPVLLSTGMATLEEIEGAVARQWSRKAATSESPRIEVDLTVMHCVSLYPCPPHLANVAAITALQHLGDEWDESNWKMVNYEHRVGYSDHTEGMFTESSCAAVALGAVVIEKHFTLNEYDDGPDHHMSANPAEFETLVCDIREFEEILGHGRKEPSEEELAMVSRLRKDKDGFQPGL